MGFAQLLDMNRRTIRAPVNPLDKSTIISVYPLKLDETKVTITPSRYILGAGSIDKPTTLTVGSASWWREIDENQPLLEIPVSSIQVADSIVRDYCVGVYMCDMQEQMPGLFFLPGDFNAEQIKANKSDLLKNAQKKQMNWYKALVTEADALWVRTNGNPLAISQQMRLAATELSMKDKPWMTNFVASVQLNNCPSCGELVNFLYPTCKYCKVVIDTKKFAELGLKFAQ